MKKLLFLLSSLFTISSISAQSVSVSEQNESFSVGNKNAIVVTIPFAKLDFVEKELKSEMKNWGGKYNSGKSENVVTQGQMKEIGEKLFDGYAKIITDKNGGIKVAFAFDLGGAFLSSSMHKEQYNVVMARLKSFGVKCSTKAVEEELKAEEKALKSLEKEQEDLVKEKEDLEKSIENYKQKIAEAEKNIEKNSENQGKKHEEIKTQKTKVEAVSKKQKSIK
jgi:molecular chaperone DnaK (HSP70)